MEGISPYYTCTWGQMTFSIAWSWFSCQSSILLQYSYNGMHWLRRVSKKISTMNCFLDELVLVSDFNSVSLYVAARISQRHAHLLIWKAHAQ